MFTNKLRLVVFILSLVTTSTLVSCDKSSTHNNAPPQEPAVSQASPVASPLSDFDRTVRFVRNGQFAYIWVFSRKDGKPFDKQDGDFLRTKAPQIVDLAMTEDRKKAVGGTNFDLEKGNMNELRKRFVVEDFTAR
jgi:hypothetical protein